MFRSHNCGELRIKDLDTQVTLCGWVHHIRDLGKLLFIDLRDRYGTTQIYFDSNNKPQLYQIAKNLGREYVIQIEGIVRERSNKNPKMPTGDIEIDVDRLTVLNKSKIPPFTIEDDTDGGEELRMQYRYLDLRRNVMKETMIFRHELNLSIRNFLSEKSFLEIETPFLIKSTPEGARDFIVPSRLNPGNFYALPQSPQLLKQLLMFAGMDRYFQIVRCFRDEDFRADRQPEFTQLDCEMSFVEREDILDLFEDMMRYLFNKLLNIDLPTFPRLTYQKAMETYGSDKPDLRFDMPIIDITDKLKGHGFKFFDDSEYIGGLLLINKPSVSRKYIDKLTEWVKSPQIGSTGMAYIRYLDGELKASISRFFSNEDLQKIMNSLKAGNNDILFIISGNKEKSLNILGNLRLKLANDYQLIQKNTFKPLWVIEFPMFEWDDENQRYTASHHPFTSPLNEDIELLDTNPAIARSNAYDMVINGVEVGGGSIRIHDKNLQKKIFKLLNLTNQEAEDKFGFFLKALDFGAPPHGGIAFGIDRILTVMLGLNSIRDVIAFPKNNMGRDLMMQAPAPISEEQLKELHIKII
ncbi:MAG: aspartate--tRNA ligase [Bacteroidales bacterium]|jgi:aspartyl-tRNA synthetase|nr:aspartate--tRNA ligase [Bacteroidales bacterium]MDI9575615.1 aspartate--tRNA ligase [Bacteroidota bacterium]MDD2593698.1 aspartate--tRNA ligase [Bacteroidales bacterium]MDD3755270.1 aspartate--tRNA ligase [Bacteroidales bacterium]MDY0401306.1 aspartate--tRNA ligase [Bacteroidales bacterium]